MPYIAQADRHRIDRQLSYIEQDISESRVEKGAGYITYVVFRLAKAFVGPKPRFWSVALAGGAILFGILEFYRRVVAPYEDAKIMENGDV